VRGSLLKNKSLYRCRDIPYAGKKYQEIKNIGYKMCHCVQDPLNSKNITNFFLKVPK